MAEVGKVTFELVSPQRLLVSQAVDMVVVPGTEGDFGVLAGHAPLISGVRTGVIDMYEGDAIAERIFVAGGFAEVTPERCIVLAEEAVPLADLDAEVIRARVRDAEEAIDDARDDAERAQPAADLEIARAMLEVAEAG
ncbi:MAG: F0F1 ATP synthase subunit epsilon [Alphaproteobacteria bacterium]|jgi:F-type H+-transporting ATPase subunit epsilon|nr:F0F1 ATP synthase subunit epsilon [Alphaproteobacteria bacterium]MDP6516952.1 F0F1 ATP synthase subunit epsilon [Alphaproteobacteria bacterium]